MIDDEAPWNESDIILICGLCGAHIDENISEGNWTYCEECGQETQVEVQEVIPDEYND
jgi:transcription elongation factor Elf1